MAPLPACHCTAKTATETGRVPPATSVSRRPLLLAGAATLAVTAFVAAPSMGAMATTVRSFPTVTHPRVLTWPAPTPATQPAGGVALDATGGLHPFGGVSLNTSGAPAFAGDLARGLAVLPDGSGGWVLDANGGVHNFGAAPQVHPTAAWSGDVARALVVLPDNISGYVLDMSGGLHPFGPRAVSFSGLPSWPGQDMARGLSVSVTSTGVAGGWVMDRTGAITSFGSVGSLGQPAHVYAGFDLWRQLHVAGSGAYLVGHEGIVETVGSPAGVSWAGLPDWGSGDSVRDIVPVNPSGAATVPAVTPGEASALMVRLQSFDRTSRGIAALTEDSSLDAIAGGGVAYNLLWCNGPAQMISGRSQDMLNRNFFSHAIPGCAGTQYVFSTYLPVFHPNWSTAGENIAWLGGVSSFADAAWDTNNNWLNSPDHFANITNAGFGHSGCGMAHGSSYQGYTGPVYIWTCEFTN